MTPDVLEAALDAEIEWRGERFSVRDVVRDGALFYTKPDSVDALILAVMRAALADAEARIAEQLSELPRGPS
jgi:hypothetical protein